MPAGATTENLSFSATQQGLAGLFLRFEDWLTARASARALYRMDDAALHDIALSRSDVELVNSSARKALWSH